MPRDVSEVWQDMNMVKLCARATEHEEELASKTNGDRNGGLVGESARNCLLRDEHRGAPIRHERYGSHALAGLDELEGVT